MTPLHPLAPRAPGLPPPALDAPALSSLGNRPSVANLTRLQPFLGIEGPGEPIRLHLEPPRLTPEDVPLNELMQQLQSVGRVPAEPLLLTTALGALGEGAAALGRALQSHPPLRAPEAAALAASFEGEARVVERSIRDLIENSTYPNFSDFLKEMVRVAQELRERATEAKLAAIEANYQLMYQAAEKMLEAANLAKESRDRQIEADRKEAIGQIVAGAFSIVVGLALGPQVGSVIGQTGSQLISGSFALAAAEDKTASSSKQHESDLANVAKQRFEAAAKLIEQQTQIAEDLRDIAKGLRDMMLRLYQDFISAQSQIIQRANV